MAEQMLRKNGWSSIVHTHIKPPPSQNGCSSKNFSSNHPCCQIARAAVKYTYPNQQQRPLPFLLSLFYSIETSFLVFTSSKLWFLLFSIHKKKSGKNLNFSSNSLTGWSENHISLKCQLRTYDFHSTPSTNIHWNLNIFEFFANINLMCAQRWVI